MCVAGEESESGVRVDVGGFWRAFSAVAKRTKRTLLTDSSASVFFPDTWVCEEKNASRRPFSGKNCKRIKVFKSSKSCHLTLFFLGLCCSAQKKNLFVMKERGGPFSTRTRFLTPPARFHTHAHTLFPIPKPSLTNNARITHDGQGA